jgi:predicted HicB family RNase H-like nuclease
MKIYIEADPFDPPVEVKYWSADTVAVFHQRLNELLTKDIHPRLEDIFSKDPHKKLIREEVRTTESEKFTKTLVVRVKPEDRELIKANAEKCSLSVSSYVRLIATGKKPQSVDSLKACRFMVKASGDLGRIKGIMHYWMGTESKIKTLPEKTRNLISDNARESLGNKVLASKIMQQFHYMIS